MSNWNMPPGVSTNDIPGNERDTPMQERYREAAEWLEQESLAGWNPNNEFEAKKIAMFHESVAALRKLASGWILVPAEPTQTMIAEAGAYDRADRAHSGWSADWGGIYRAMIAAAPDAGGTT